MVEFVLEYQGTHMKDLGHKLACYLKCPGWVIFLAVFTGLYITLIVITVDAWSQLRFSHNKEANYYSFKCNLICDSNAIIHTNDQTSFMK